MNYTKPNKEDHEDSPQDWLNSSLIFARAISLLLKERRGIVVDIKGDVDLGENIEKVIVFKRDGQIVIEISEPGLEEGDMVKIIDSSLN
jgi:hypothetical protein